MQDRRIVVKPLQDNSQQPKSSYECAQESAERAGSGKLVSEAERQHAEEAHDDDDVDPVHVKDLLQEMREGGNSGADLQHARQQEIGQNDARLNAAGDPNQFRYEIAVHE